MRASDPLDGDSQSAVLAELRCFRRRAPVQEQGSRRRPGHIPPGTVPWSVHELAWKGYAKAGNGDQSAECIAERGGFGYREMQYALAGDFNACMRDDGRALPPVPGWEPKK